MALMDLARKVPTMNAQAKKRLEAGRALQLQRAAQQASTGAGAAKQFGQQVSPALTAQAGQAQLEQQQQARQQMAGLASADIQSRGQEADLTLQKQGVQQQEALQGKQLSQQMGLQREQLALNKALTQDEIASAKRLSEYGLSVDENLSSMTRKQREDLAMLGGDVKNKLFDAQLVFERNEAGRKFSNQRQMMRAVVANAKSQQELRTKLNTMQQEAAKEMFMLEAAHKQMAAALERGYLDDKRELDQASRQKLATMAEQIRRKIERKKRNAANQAMIIQGVFTVGGAVAGGGTPAGAMAGSAVGNVVAGSVQ